MLTDARDWQDTFLPAILALFNGGNLYDTIYNPPWVLFPLIPFALSEWGRILMVICAVLSFGLIIQRLKAKPITAAILVLSTFAYLSLAWGNIEWLALLGLVTVPPVSFLLLAIKPQMTICIIVFQMVELWRKGQRKRLWVSLAALGLAFGMSFLVYGNWLLRLGTYSTFTDSPVNTSFYPWSVPLGASLFIASLVTRKIQFAIAASPMFFAVVTPQTWLVVIAALSGIPIAMLFTVLSSWVITLYIKSQ